MRGCNHIVNYNKRERNIFTESWGRRRGRLLTAATHPAFFSLSRPVFSSTSSFPPPPTHLFSPFFSVSLLVFYFIHFSFVFANSTLLRLLLFDGPFSVDSIPPPFPLSLYLSAYFPVFKPFVEGVTNFFILKNYCLHKLDIENALFEGCVRLYVSGITGSVILSILNIYM